MSKLFYHVMQDNLGNLLFDVSGTMRLAGTGTLATIYGDEGLTVPIANPLTNHPSFGSFKCYLGPGLYDFYMAKSGYTFETLTGVQGAGTMAQQNANAVAISGGSATLTGLLTAAGSMLVPTRAGSDVIGVTLSVAAGGGTNRWNLYAGGDAPNLLQGQLALGGLSAEPYCALHAVYHKAYTSGIILRPMDNDTGAGPAVSLHNLGGTTVGSITTTASATAYNTSSDVRLKEFVEKLVGSLDIIRVLNPISFLWKSNNERGEGLAANELQQVIPYAVTGEPDAINDDGSILPQQVDYSKLVPRLVGAIQELLARVEALELLRAP